MSDLRNDEWAEQVHTRILCAVSDLHAADAWWYHRDCKPNFMEPCPKSKANAKESQKDDNAMWIQTVTSNIRSDCSQVYNSVEIFTICAYLTVKPNFLDASL